MKWLWTWSGRFFGYRDGDNLWTHDGQHIGQFYENEIYNQNGKYLGEIINENRLITNLNKKNYTKSGFLPYVNRVGYVKFVDYIGYVMYAGYEDFPKLEGQEFLYSVFRGHDT